MAYSPVLRRNSVLKSSVAKFLARIRFRLWPACFCVAWICVAWVCVAPSHAAISTGGDVTPSPPSGDPWYVSGPLYVGYVASGNMTINGGSDVIDTDGWVGYAGTGTVGTVVVQNSGSRWVNVEDLQLGTYVGGVGSLSVSDFGTVLIGDAASSGIAGRLTVSDSDSSGTAGGNLRVYNGSTLTHSGTAIVGDGAGEYGWAMVDGTGSSWTNGGYLSVGEAGSGTLTIQNSGSVSTGSGWIGYNSSGAGTVTVDGTDSFWTNSGSLYVGNQGSGTLTVQNGGNVSNTNGWLGYDSGTGTVTVDGDDSIWENTGDLQLGRSGGGAGSLTTSNSGMVLVGDAASSGLISYLIVSDADSSGTAGGHLRVYNGSTLPHGSSAILGDSAGEYGWATVDGTGSSWTNSGTLYVGRIGSGTLTVQNGGNVSSNNGWIGWNIDSTGTVTVDGTDSSWTNSGYLRVSHGGSGTLTVQNGGLVSNTSGWIGYNTGIGTGTVTVDGADSTWENTEDLQLGSSFGGAGSLTISASGTVRIGDAASSGLAGHLTVSDSDSSGFIGGHLRVYNGSTLTHGSSAVVGNSAGEYGWATVDGAGSSWTNFNYLHVGYYGSGTLNIQNGGSVSSYHGRIGYHADSTGTVTVDGADSSWTNINFYAGLYGSGTLTIQNGGSVSNGTGALGFYSTGTGTATVKGIDSSWTNNADLDVGYDGQGTLTIAEGGLVSVAGTLTIDHNTDGDSYINMSIGGMLALFGDADDSLTEFLDLIDGTDAINYWNESISDWDDIANAMPYRDFTLNYLTAGDLSGYTLLTVRRAIPGDADGDGDVDVSDLGILATNYGTLSGMAWGQGDFSDDDAVDVSDLGILATNYGYGTAVATSAVPEPSTIGLLLCLGGLALSCGITRRNKP